MDVRNGADDPKLPFDIQNLPPIAQLFLAPARKALDVAARLTRGSAPSLLHLFVIVSFVPVLTIWSLAAGLIIRSWIPVGWDQDLYLQYGEGRLPYAQVDLPELYGGQKYDLSVELHLPLFAHNAELGNFMTSIAIIDPYNETVAHVSRPSLVFPPKLYSSPFIISGVLDSQSVTIPLLSGFSTSSYLSSLKALVQIGRRDGWQGVGNGQGRELVVTEAYLKVVPVMPGLRGFLARHSLLLLALTSGAFFVVSLFSGIIAYIFLAPRLTLAPRPQSDDRKVPIKTEDEPRYLKTEESEPSIPLTEETDIDEEDEETPDVSVASD